VDALVKVIALGKWQVFQKGFAFVLSIRRRSSKSRC